jgi:hypothetical protein
MTIDSELPSSHNGNGRTRKKLRVLLIAGLVLLVSVITLLWGGLLVYSALYLIKALVAR